MPARSLVVALPPADAVLEALGPVERAQVARMWRRRSENERHTSGVFAALSRALLEHGAASPVLELARAAVGEELAHCTLCERVAARYAPDAQESPADLGARDLTPLASPGAPQFHGCTERESALLFVVLQCCLNETIAAAYLRSCLEQAEGPLAQAAVRELLRDEVSHSRIGWAHLASDHVTAEGRALVARAMPELLKTITRVWLADPDGVHAAAPRGHGSLPNGELGRVVLETVDAIVAPGLAHVGVSSESTLAWLAAQRA